MIDEDIAQDALLFVRANKNRIAKELTDTQVYIPDLEPVSIFMAGSPGAGKTELSKNLIKILEQDKNQRILRIDADEIRSLMPGYVGGNSYLFQVAVSVVVDRIHDLALQQEQSFLLDSTFSRYEKALENIRRSLSRNRQVLIFYVYQHPEVAWKFTQAREAAEGRHIPKEAFIERFIASKEVINLIRRDFGKEVVIFLVKKDFETHAVEDVIEIKQQDPSLDNYLEKNYTEEDLREIL